MSGDSPDLQDWIQDIKSDDESRVKRGLIGIARMGPQAAAAVPVLVRTAERVNSPVLSSIAVSALGRIGPAAVSAVPALCTLLDRFRDHLFGATIARALGKIGSPGALPTLHKARKTRQGVLNKAAWKAIRRIEQARGEK